VRVNGQPRKLYLGKGDAALAQAQENAEKQQERQAERESLLTDQARLAPADAALHELVVLADLLAKATLLIWGYHQHHGGEWRRWRITNARQDRTGEDAAE